jgi:hypothetical protein
MRLVPLVQNPRAEAACCSYLLRRHRPDVRRLSRRPRPSADMPTHPTLPRHARPSCFASARAAAASPASSAATCSAPRAGRGAPPRRRRRRRPRPRRRARGGRPRAGAAWRRCGRGGRPRALERAHAARCGGVLESWAAVLCGSLHTAAKGPHEGEIKTCASPGSCAARPPSRSRADPRGAPARLERTRGALICGPRRAEDGDRRAAPARDAPLPHEPEGDAQLGGPARGLLRRGPPPARPRRRTCGAPPSPGIESHLPRPPPPPPSPPPPPPTTTTTPLPRSQAEKLRARFEAAPGGDPAVIERSLLRGEAELAAHAHPDPYITPYRPGGSLYARNPPLPEGVKIHLDFGREGGH